MIIYLVGLVFSFIIAIISLNEKNEKGMTKLIIIIFMLISSWIGAALFIGFAIKVLKEELEELKEQC